MTHTTTRGALLASVLLAVLAANTTHAAEVCGDGTDNDADNATDEDCYPDLMSGVCESPLDCGAVGTPEPNGGLRLVRPPDLAVSVAFGPSLAFQRTYQSHYAPGGTNGDRRLPMGPNQQHNFMSWIAGAAISNPSSVVLRARTGQDIRWAHTSTASGWRYFTPQLGYNVKHLRQRDSSPYDWELENLDGTGLTFNWTVGTGFGRLLEVQDSLATPKKLTVTYTASGDKVDKVTDASTTRELRFVYDGTTGLLTTVALWENGTLRVTRIFEYDPTSKRMTAVKDGVATLESYTWNTSLGRLASVASGGSTLLSYTWDSGSKLIRVVTPSGGMAITYAVLTNPTVDAHYFNETTTACTSDANCSGVGGTCNVPAGLCYLAKRQVTYTANASLYPLPDAVSSTCATCTEVEDYAWSATYGLLGTRDGESIWTSYLRNSDGTTARIVEGDSDSDASTFPASGHRVTYLLYTNGSLPGLVTDQRRKSEFIAGTCDAGVSTGCKRTQTTYSTDGKATSVTESGFTLNTSGNAVAFAYTTGYEYDTSGRVTAIRGARGTVPLPVYDDVEYTYWGGSNASTNYVFEVKRRTGVSTYLTSTMADYDHWGNATRLTDSNAKSVCRTFEGLFGLLASSRRVIDGSHTACGTSGGLDETTGYEYDTQRRLTKTTKPRGDCTTNSYDAAGRLTTVRASDACNGTGDTMTHTYNTDGRLTKTEWKLNGSTLTRSQEYTYGADRRVARALNPADTSKYKEYLYKDDGVPSEVRFEDYATSAARTTWDVDGLNRTTAERRYTTASLAEDWVITPGVQLDLPKQIRDEALHDINLIWDDLNRKVRQETPETGPILYVRDEAGNVTTRIESAGLANAKTNTFTYDTLNRLLTEDYGDASCGTGQGAEVQYSYDVLPGGTSCPSGSTCTLLSERLVLAKAKVACDAAAGDKTLDQLTFYAYDNAGRILEHTVTDDTGRKARTQYVYDKNSNVTQEYAPSGNYTQWIMGGASNTSDHNRQYQMGRNATQLVYENFFYPWGRFNAPGLAMAFDHGGTMYRTRFQQMRDVADRPTYSAAFSTFAPQDNVFRIDYGQDARGRISKRDFSYGTAAQIDQFFLYDDLSRVTCRSRTSQAACPNPGSVDLMENVTYNSSADRATMRVKRAPFAELLHTYVPRTSYPEQIGQITLSAGQINFAYDTRGNRLSDDDTNYAAGATDERRTYTYDARNNLVTVSGQYLFAMNNFNHYTMTNAYDERNRRIFKSFVDTDTNTEAQWFFYYNQKDQLIEAKHTPNIATPGTYAVYSWHWLEGMPIAYYQVDFVANVPTTTTRRFLMTDEQGRPHSAWSFPTSGSTARVWEVEAGTWGNDAVTVGAGIYQPLRFPGQHADVETQAIASIGWILRPGLSDNRYRMFDPGTGTFLQVDELLQETQSHYTYADQNPIGLIDEDGLMARARRSDACSRIETPCDFTRCLLAACEARRSFTEESILRIKGLACRYHGGDCGTDSCAKERSSNHGCSSTPISHNIEPMMSIEYPFER